MMQKLKQEIKVVGNVSKENAFPTSSGILVICIYRNLPTKFELTTINKKYYALDRFRISN